MDSLLRSDRKAPDSNSYGNRGSKFLLSISGRDYVDNLPGPFGPEEVRLSTGDEAPLLDDARLIQTELRGHQAAANSTPAAITLQTKVANAEQMKVHPAEAGLRHRKPRHGSERVSLRVHGKGNLGVSPGDEAILEFYSRSKNV